MGGLRTGQDSKAGPPLCSSGTKRSWLPLLLGAAPPRGCGVSVGPSLVDHSRNRARMCSAARPAPAVTVHRQAERSLHRWHPWFRLFRAARGSRSNAKLKKLRQAPLLKAICRVVRTLFPHTGACCAAPWLSRRAAPPVTAFEAPPCRRPQQTERPRRRRWTTACSTTACCSCLVRLPPPRLWRRWAGTGTARPRMGQHHPPSRRHPTSGLQAPGSFSTPRQAGRQRGGVCRPARGLRGAVRPTAPGGLRLGSLQQPGPAVGRGGGRRHGEAGRACLGHGQRAGRQAGLLTAALLVTQNAGAGYGGWPAA
jgi:hypothetical protein